jgi:hypothetical protein
MNKLNVISALAIGLLVINIILIGFNYWPKPPRGEGPRNEIIQRLQLDEQQITTYDTLIQQHRKAIRQLDADMLTIKKELYAQLTKPQDSLLTDSLLSLLASKQLAIESVHFAHFKDIHSLCKPTQEDLFVELTQDLHRLFPRRNMKPKD